jgi:hypothetical protein
MITPSKRVGARMTRRTRKAAATSALAVVAALVVATPAFADPILTTQPAGSGDVGAAPVDTSISSPPSETFNTSARIGSTCTFANPTPPAGLTIKHVAPCQTGTGTGSATNPWKTIAQAMASLQPNEVAYIHDDASLAVDYTESNLTPTNSGTSTARIRIMAAPGETPVIKKGVANNQPIFNFNKPWWIFDGLRTGTPPAAVSGLVIDATGVGSGGSGPSTSVIRVLNTDHVVLRNLIITNGDDAKAMVQFEGATNSALLNSTLRETVTAGRPDVVPVNTYDHHGVAILNGADKVLIRDNDSFGHNGDSVQCGEETSTSVVIPTNITIQNNRLHENEENAIDIKACRGLTIRGNKMFGFRPARGGVNRAPQGDALIVQYAPSTTRTSDRVLVEQNRFWDNSRSVNLFSSVPKVVVRRNLVFNSSIADCGMGAGISVTSLRAEVYNNTIDNMTPAGATMPAGCNAVMSNWWSTTQTAAVSVAPPTGSTAVLWNNIVSNASNPYKSSGTYTLDSDKNLFSSVFAPAPAGSIFGNPLYVANPTANDYYTQQGSPARDAARVVPSSVGDTTTLCDDPTPAEGDLLVEPDIGFLESCS